MSAEKKTGRRRVVNAGEWLTRSQIAIRAVIDREIVSKYLGMEGAPKPDNKMRFNYKQAMEWIGDHAPRAGAGGNEIRKIKEASARIQLERDQLELDELRGRLVDKKEIAPQIGAACAAFVAGLQRIHEGELPPKIAGKSVIEIRELIAAGNDRLIRELNDMLAPLTK